MQELTVLHLISSAGCHGAETMLVNLAVSQKRLGWQPRVVIFYNLHCPHLEFVDLLKQRDCAFEVVSCRGRLDWSAVRQIRNIAHRDNIDVLHAHGYKADIYGCLAARRLPAVAVATCHNWTGENFNVSVYEFIDRLVLRRFQTVIAVSDGIAHALRQAGVAAEKIELIRNGIDTAPFSTTMPNDASGLRKGRKLVVGMVARMVREKGAHHLLMAAAEILKSFPDTLFLFVGDGPAREQLEHKAQTLGISSSVFFAGERQDMPQVYAAMDIFVLPSLLEAMPMSIMEAMAAGKPIVATSVGSIPDMVENGQSGFIVPPESESDLRQALSLLLGNAGLRSEMGKRAREAAEARFSALTMAKDYCTLYERVIGTPAMSSKAS